MAERFVGTALVIGATSDIGRETARLLAAQDWTLQLAGRDASALAREACDIEVRSGKAPQVLAWDALEGGSLVDDLDPLPDLAVCLVGLLGDQAQSQRDAQAAARVMRTNYTAPALLLGALAERFEERGSGVLVGVASVAGDRGRAANYVYGSAKAGMTAFLSGLRSRLARHGVHVATVKPGFVDTRMTAGMDLPPLLTASPEEAARAIVSAAARRRDVVYVRPIWKLIMLLIRALPEGLFKRLSL